MEYVFNTDVRAVGQVFLTIRNADGTHAKMAVRNKVVRLGRAALARGLANDFSGPYRFYIARVLFGNSGSVGGAPRLVEDGRTGLFGPVTLTKPVIASVDPDLVTNVVFTTTVGFDELVGDVINEMALEMSTGDIFSMVTFGDITKSSSMELVWNWGITYV